MFHNSNLSDSYDFWPEHFVQVILINIFKPLESLAGRAADLPFPVNGAMVYLHTLNRGIYDDKYLFLSLRLTYSHCGKGLNL